MSPTSGIEWDEDKRQRNILERQVDFIDAALIFENEAGFLEAPDHREDYGEIRYLALGEARGKYLIVAYTWRGPNRRIITAWEVNEHGRRRYQTVLARRAQGDAGAG